MWKILVNDQERVLVGALEDLPAYPGAVALSVDDLLGRLTGEGGQSLFLGPEVVSCDASGFLRTSLAFGDRPEPSP